MKTIKIKGKDYVTVVERVKELHKVHPEAEIRTEVISDNGVRVVVKATVNIRPDKDGFVNREFTGHSQARWDVGMMKDVALEVAETSAVGRALGFAGIGLLEGIASADEIRKAKITDKPPFGKGSVEEDNQIID